MVADLQAMRDWRRPGCDDRCTRRVILMIGERHKHAAEFHNPDAHEEFGRRSAEPPVTITGPLSIDHAAMTVCIDEKPVAMTRTEARILCHLASRIGTLCYRNDILRDVWGPEYATESHTSPESHLIRVAMSRLRGRLGRAANLIETKLGLGYRLLHVSPCTSDEVENIRRWRVAGRPCGAQYNGVAVGPLQQRVLEALERAPGRRLPLGDLVAANRRRNLSLTPYDLVRSLDAAMRGGVPLQYQYVPKEPSLSFVWLTDGAP